MPIPVYDTTIHRITQETPTTKTLRLPVPEGFSFKPGQFVMVLFELGGKTERRAYSISSSPLERGYIDLTIKREENSKGGGIYLHSLQEGDSLRIQGPFGMFTAGEEKHSVFIAAGSGIAPFRCMWRYRIAKEIGTTDVLFCAPTKDHLIFFDELEQLEREGKLHVYFSTTREHPEDWRYATCRFTLPTIKEHAMNYGESTFYLCGSPRFCEAMKQLLLDDGIPKERVRMEKYW